MCAKKENYYETFTWLEETIESCNTIDEETSVRKKLRTFENTLLKDDSINSYVFGQFMNRLHDKINNQYNIILDSFNN